MGGSVNQHNLPGGWFNSTHQESSTGMTPLNPASLLLEIYSKKLIRQVHGIDARERKDDVCGITYSIEKFKTI